MHLIFVGLLMGWGAAVPIGPVNLEIIRRNLVFGTRYGLVLGVGASLADLTYFILLASGGLVLIEQTTILRILGIVGALILFWFGFSALRMKVKANHIKVQYKTFWRTGSDGYLMTISSPITVLIWGSISSQIALLEKHYQQATLFGSIGVIIATLSWVIFLNLLLHYTRHRLSAKSIHWLNITGGIILLGFAVVGIVNAVR